MKRLAIHMFIFLFFTAALISSTLAVSSRASYGEPCSSEVRCDSRKFLACSPSSGECDCLMANSMTFDNITEQCVTLAGERCEYTTAEGDRSWSDMVPCIDSASCKSGICECDANYFEIANGTCQQKRDYDQECLSHGMCEENRHLMCGDAQKCVCQKNRIFSPMRLECVLRAGETCSYGEKCTDYADCLLSLSTCKCESGYFQSENGTCEEKRTRDQPCVEDVHCKDTVLLPGYSFASVPSLMKCLEGKCDCDPAVARPFSEQETQFCGKMLNMSCSFSKENNCIKGAICESPSETCQCEASTHFPTENGTCEPRRLHGQPCSDHSPCDYDQKRLICNATTNTCSCAEGGVLDMDYQECRGSPSSPCTTGNYRNCVSNAKCHTSSYKCQCVGDTSKSLSRKDYCYVQEGRPCYGDISEAITTRTCLPGLLCSNRTCTCPYGDYQTFYLPTESCVSHLGGPCQDNQDCEENTHTVCATEGDGSGPLQCRCERGYIAVGGKCQLAHGEKCSKRGTDLCDTAAPLECSSRGICECVKLQVYDNQTEICRGLVGARCVLWWLNKGKLPTEFCVEGAMCQQLRGSQGKMGVCKCEPGRRAQEDGTCQLIRKDPIGSSTEDGTDSVEESMEERDVFVV